MSRHGTLRRRTAGALVAALLAGAVLPVPGAGATPRADATADDGAWVVRETRIDARTIDLEIRSPALGITPGLVRLLTPQGWSKGDGRTWPVLYLLHGCCDIADYKAWTEYTDVEQFTEDKPALIVMPTAGRIGMYSDWWNFGLYGSPSWATFHMTEVRQILERGYGAGTRRAIAGLSMGAYGAMEYASRYPGMFGAAAAYSGAIDVLAPGIPEVTQANLVAQGFPLWGGLWGDPLLQRARWEDHNPALKVDSLRGTQLYVSCGNGVPGPLDTGLIPPAVGALIESNALVNTLLFVDRLRARNIPATIDLYGAGTHTWPYWQFALHRSWPVLASGMGI
ncbi:alpha/beta hydrolase [Actinophytocola oryzae]|uniref:Acyl-CoA:diacylglycerol acyltransferase n=1 Tax=Actinophytocola oryzae TaxID=502181 RepID=A0A4R7UYQ4_9PSEU|nr:alpha/beta hydrolase family protein [Actinophytocola oryzae]TDV41324.1 S-formylglutathione hydrolase FrmB [Actinophytocola oryzae]